MSLPAVWLQEEFQFVGRPPLLTIWVDEEEAVVLDPDVVCEDENPRNTAVVAFDP